VSNLTLFLILAYVFGLGLLSPPYFRMIKSWSAALAVLLWPITAVVLALWMLAEWFAEKSE